MNPHVLGLDLSLSSPGAARVYADKRVRTYRHPAPLPEHATWHQRAARIRDHVAWIRDHIQVSTALVVIEAPALGVNMPGQHELAGNWWAVYAMLARVVTATGPLPIGRISPTTLKARIAGHGHADKAAMQRAVVRLYPGQGLHTVGNDEIDAVALATLGVAKLASIHGRELWDGPWLDARALAIATTGDWEHLPEPPQAVQTALQVPGRVTGARRAAPRRPQAPPALFQDAP